MFDTEGMSMNTEGRIDTEDAGWSRMYDTLISPDPRYNSNSNNLNDSMIVFTELKYFSFLNLHNLQ